MTRHAARKFWRTYITLASRDSAYYKMANPALDFSARERAGEFDRLPCSRYEKLLEDVEAVSTFWGQGQLETAGNILLNALAGTELSSAEIDGIAGILADASAKTDYCAADPEETQECAGSPFNGDTNGREADDSPEFSVDSPRSIYSYLDRHIYGQEPAKRAVSMLVYHHLEGNSRNIVMAGKSGSGKTEIWRALSKVCSYIRIINGPQLSCDGWKGSLKISDIFTCETEQAAGRLILVIDEADKMMEPHVASGGTDQARMIQNELLKLMDGDTLTFVDEKNRNSRTTVDCSGISVVLCGSFERMLQAKSESSGSIGFGRQEKTESSIGECTEEDLVQYANMRREIAGRISRIVTLDTMDADDYEAIMESPSSPVRKIEKAHHVSLSVDPDSRKRLASDAAGSGMGCRFIRSKLQSLLDDQMFDRPDAKEYSLHYG